MRAVATLRRCRKSSSPPRTTLNNLNQEIDNLKKQLQTQGEKLNEQTRADMVKNIEAKQKTLQRQVEDAQADFQGQQNEIANRIGGKLLEVLDKYAKTERLLGDPRCLRPAEPGALGCADHRRHPGNRQLLQRPVQRSRPAPTALPNRPPPPNRPAAPVASGCAQAAAPPKP